MNSILFSGLIAVGLIISSPIARGAETSALSSELKGAVDAVRMSIVSGNKTEADLAGQLKELDNMLEKHKDEKTDDVAQVLLMKAMLYIQVLDRPDEGIALLNRLRTDYAETTQGKNADQILEDVKQQAAAKKIRNALVEGARFPDFEVNDLDGKPLSIANYKGKVVLIVFWASWYRPSVRELPNMLKAYEEHHKDGFEIIGISLDEDKGKLEKSLKDNKIPWPQYFDGKGWDNRLALKFGVNSIPAMFLVDGEGNIIGRDLRGSALEDALDEALPKKTQ